jgi:hypothetical protein
MLTKEQTLENFFKRVWLDVDASAIDEMFKPDGTASGLGDQVLIGPEGFKVFHNSLCTLLKNINTTIDKCIEEGDWISVLINIDAQVKTSGQSVSFSGSCYGKIVDGIITEAYNNIDFMGLFCQLGLLPEDCFATGLSGCRIQ